MRNNKKGFTLIELLVSILIAGILMQSGSSFFDSIQAKKNDNNNINSFNKISNSINDFSFSELTLIDYFVDREGSFEDIKYNEDYKYNMNYKLGFSMKTYSPVLVNKHYKIYNENEGTDIYNYIINESDLSFIDKTDISLGFQECIYFFNEYGNYINGNSFEKKCGNVILGENSFEMQGYLLSNYNNIKGEYNGKELIEGKEYNNYQYYYQDEKDNYIYLSDEYGRLKNTPEALSIYHFDLKEDSLENFFNNPFFIINLKDYYGNTKKGVIKGDETHLVDLIKNNYIPYIRNESDSFINKTINEIESDRRLANFFNYGNISITHNNKKKDNYLSEEVDFISIKK